MEDSLKPRHESDDDESLQTPLAKKRKSIGSFLSGWRQMVSEEEGKTHDTEADIEDEEEEDSEESSSSKRFRRYFKRLFPATVDRPEGTEESVETSHNEPETKPITERLPSGFVLPSREVTPITDEVEPAEETVETEPVHHETPLIAESGLEIESPPADESEVAEPESIEPTSPTPSSSSAESYGGGAAFMRYERTTPPETSKEKPEIPYHKHSNAPAWMAFLGGEFLSRRRDRKLKKEQEKQAEVLRSVQKDQRENQLREKAVQEQAMEASQSRPNEKLEIRAQSDRHMETSEEQKPEVPIAHIEAPPTFSANELNPQRYRELSSHDKPEMLPHHVQEQVEVAADKNIPIESLYERRHETKDENKPFSAPKTVITGDQSPQAVSEILSSPEFDTARRIAEQASRGTPQDKRLYSNAMRTGFITAMAIIFIVCVYLLFR